MNCEQYQNLLSDLIEGSLTPSVCEEIEAHLSACARVSAVSGTDSGYSCDVHELNWITLKRSPGASAAVERPSRFLGRYRSVGSHEELVVAACDGSLYIDAPHRRALIPKQAAALYVTATCVELSFSDEQYGKFQRLKAQGNLPNLKPEWIRVPCTRDGRSSGTAFQC